MKHIKKYGKFVVYYLLFALASYLLTGKVVDRLPAIIRDNVATFIVFLIFNFLLIPISATKEILLMYNKYNLRTLIVTTLVSILIIFATTTFIIDKPTFLPYSLTSINQNELVDPADFVEIKTSQKSIESIFHTTLKNIGKNSNMHNVFCTTSIYDLNPKKLDHYFPSIQVSEFVAETIHKDPNFYSIFVCNTDTFYFSITTDRVSRSKTPSTEPTSTLRFMNLATGKYSEDSIKLDSVCQSDVLFLDHNLYIKCDKSSFDADKLVDETTLYQINTTNFTSKKIYSCKKTLMGRETCIDQNQNKYYDKTATMQ